MNIRRATVAMAMALSLGFIAARSEALPKPGARGPAPVADVREYDYRPVRGFVRDAIREESRKVGTPIHCDWNGDFGRAFGIQHGTSTVILLGRDNTVLFSHEGKLPKNATDQLLRLLRDELAPST